MHIKFGFTFQTKSSKLQNKLDANEFLMLFEQRKYVMASLVVNLRIFKKNTTTTQNADESE